MADENDDGDDRIEILAVTNSTTEDGQPRVNVGDTSDNAGAGASVRMFGPCGFWGGCALPDASGGAAQVVRVKSGPQHAVIGCTDDRELNQLPSPLDWTKDRACLSSAGPLHWKLLGGPQQFVITDGQPSGGTTVKVDASLKEVDVEVANARLTVVQSGVAGGYNDGVIDAFVNATGAGVTLSYTVGGITCSVMLGPAGRIDIVAPGGLYLTSPQSGGVPTPVTAP